MKKFFDNLTRKISNFFTKIQADVLLYVGIKNYTRSKLEVAINFWQRALKLYKQIGYKQGVANSLNNLGNVYYFKREYNKYREYYEQSLTISIEIDYKEGVANSLNGLGFGKIDDQRGVANCFDYLGIASRCKGEYDKAIAYHEQSLAIKRQIGDQQGEGISLGNLALVYYSKGEYDKATAYHEQSLAIKRQIGNQQRVVRFGMRRK